MKTPAVPAGPAHISVLGVWLARAQQLKDTVTILGMNFMLLFGLLMFGLPIPGLVLYFLRWRLTRGKARRAYAALLWALGLGHELLLFASTDAHAELHDMADYLTLGYTLGAGISVAGLLTSLFPTSHSSLLPDERHS
jgi:hypothetical protein